MEDFKIFVGGGRMFYIGFNTQTALVKVFRSQIGWTEKQGSSNWQNHSFWATAGCSAQLETQHAEWAGKGCRTGPRQRSSPVEAGKAASPLLAPVAFYIPGATRKQDPVYSL